MITDRPIIILTLNRIGERAALRMALDARVRGLDVVHSARIQDVAARSMLDMLAPRAMAALAAYVPFRHLLGLNVVVDGMAAIAGGASGPLHIVGRIKLCPPVRARCHH